MEQIVVRMNPLQMKRVVAGKIVSAIGRANAPIAAPVGQHERFGRQVVMVAVGKREITHPAGRSSFPNPDGRRPFRRAAVGIADLTQVGVMPGVATNLDAGIGQGPNLVGRVGSQRCAECRRRAERAGPPARFAKRRSKSPESSDPASSGSAIVAVVGIAVVERDADRRPAVVRPRRCGAALLRARPDRNFASARPSAARTPAARWSKDSRCVAAMRW